MQHKICFIGFLVCSIVELNYAKSFKLKATKSVSTPFPAINKSNALFLTPYIENGRIEEARKASRVKLPGIEIESYSGLLTVNSKFNSNIFFWFFPALSGRSKAPVLLWLNGGPGGSSLLGLFYLNGPLQLNAQLEVSFRNITWNREFSMIFIDQPVGTGFSFTTDDRGYARTEEQIGRDLYEAMRQFFIIFSSHRSSAFFLTGQSYAGKYIPSLGNTIHVMNRNKFARHRINLQGMAIGASYSDPINQANFADYLFQIGLIDWRERKHFLKEQAKYLGLIRRRKYVQATELIGDLFSNSNSYFNNVTGYNSEYNYLLDNNPEEFYYFLEYVNSSSIRKAIHVGRLPLSQFPDSVINHLLADISISVNPMIEKLLNANYRLMFYSGNVDLTVALPFVENFLTKLHWKGRAKYLRASRKIYRIHNQVVGYVRKADNLLNVVIRNAGHEVPHDQPQVAFDMISRFVNNVNF